MTVEKLTNEKFNELKNSSVIIDTRHPEIFAKGYIQGSINIPIEGAFYKWAIQVVPKESAIILITDNEDTINDTIRQLAYINLNNVLGFIVFDSNSMMEKETLKLLNVNDLNDNIDDFYVVDVRTPPEWNDGHIESAHHMDLIEFKQKLESIPKDKQVAITCGAGFRSSIAASILKASGHDNVASIQGGMRAWNQANLPIK